MRGEITPAESNARHGGGADALLAHLGICHPGNKTPGYFLEPEGPLNRKYKLDIVVVIKLKENIN